MIKITCKLTGHELSLVNAPVVSSDSVEFDAVKFQFDTNWTGFHKVAVFWGSDTDTAYGSLVDDNDEAVIPTAILEEKATIRFGVFGEDPDGLLPRITSTILKYKIKEGAWSESFYGDDEATQSLVDQLRVLVFAISEETHQFVEDSTEAYETFTENSTEAYEAFTQECTDIVEAAKDYVLDAMETKVEEDMPGIITGWLNDHVNPESDVVIDDTLSISGAAADAAACGVLKSALNYIPAEIYKGDFKVEQTISSSGVISVSPYGALTDYIPAIPGQTYYFPFIKDSNNIDIHCFVAEYREKNVSSFIIRKDADNKTIVVGNATNYIRILFTRNSSTGVTMTTQDIENYFTGRIGGNNIQMYSDIQKLLPLDDKQVWFNALNLDWTLRQIITISGNIETPVTSATTYYIPVNTDEVYEIKNAIDGNGITIESYIALYDSGHNFIRRVGQGMVKIPAGISYIRFVFARSALTGITMTQTDINTYFVCKIWQIGKRIQDALTQLEQTVEEESVSFAYNGTWEFAKTVTNAGNESAATTYALSSYTPVNGIFGFRTLAIKDNNNNPFNTFIVSYDSKKRFISRLTGDVIFSPDTVYYRVVFGRAASTGIQPTQNTINEFFEIEKLTEAYILSGKANRYDKPKNLGVLNCILRAKQLAMLQFKTKAVLPCLVSDIPANTNVIGVPYSSVRMEDKFVGLNVSIHTFMTAVNNPNSVLYTKSLTTENAKTYYGAVCTSFTAYALNTQTREIAAKIFVNTTDYTTVPLNDIQLGDICVNNAHDILIIGIIRDYYGRISDVITAEAASPKCVITSYPYNEFVSYVTTMGYRIARYNRIDYTPYVPSPYVPLMNEAEESIVYQPICTEYGDKAMLPLNTDVKINVLDGTGATAIKVYLDDELLNSYGVSDFTLTNLNTGMYEAHLTNGGTVLGITKWSICDASISKAGNRVSFGDFENCTPRYISFNDATGVSYHCIPLTAQDIENGYIDTDYSGVGVNWLKIYVENEYGCTSFGVVI